MQRSRLFALPAIVGIAALLGAVPLVSADDLESLAARVQQLEDREEIRELLLAYGRALDNRDFVAFSDLFAEEEGEWVGGLARISHRP